MLPKFLFLNGTMELSPTWCSSGVIPGIKTSTNMVYELVHQVLPSFILLVFDAWSGVGPYEYS